MAARKTFHDWLDVTAMFASTICMLHCLVLPIVIAATPAMSRWLDLGEGFHVAILLFAIPVSAVALLGGWRRYGRPVPVVLGLIGLGLMAAGLLMETEFAETVVTVAGSVVLAAGHLLNWRFRQRCAC